MCIRDSPKGLQVTAFTLRYDASTDIFSVTLEIGDRSRQTLSQTSFEGKRINRCCLLYTSIPISRHQRNIRQSELDSKAETIYLAAQNRLSQLQASGRSDEYGKDRATALNNIPWDADQDKYTTSTLYYVTSAAKSTDTSAAGSILPREQVEAELWDANWVIEYDPGSGSVYACLLYTSCVSSRSRLL